MTVRECSFILPGGRKCRCAATRNQALCRHHAPKLAVAGPPPLPKRERWSRLMRWRQLGSNIPWMPLSQIPDAVYEILNCLIDRGPGSTGEISDLAAGRFLRALLNRLGEVPFPDPEFASQPAEAQPGAADLEALLSALAPKSGSQSHASLRQSRVRMSQ